MIKVNFVCFCLDEFSFDETMEEVTSEVSFMRKVYHSLTFEWLIIDMQSVKPKSSKLRVSVIHMDFY